MNNKYLCALLLSFLSVANMHAQIRDAILDLFATDSLELIRENVDSLEMEELKRELEEAPE